MVWRGAVAGTGMEVGECVVSVVEDGHGVVETVRSLKDVYPSEGVGVVVEARVVGWCSVVLLGDDGGGSGISCGGEEIGLFLVTIIVEREVRVVLEESRLVRSQRNRLSDVAESREGVSRGGEKWYERSVLVFE